MYGIRGVIHSILAVDVALSQGRDDEMAMAIVMIDKQEDRLHLAVLIDHSKASTSQESILFGF